MECPVLPQCRVLLVSYEEQLRQREMLYQQQQQRLYQEVREEKERVAESARRQRADVDALQRKLEDTHANLMASVRTEYEQTKAEQEKRHQVSNNNNNSNNRNNNNNNKLSKNF